MLKSCFDNSGNFIDDKFSCLVSAFRTTIYAHAKKYYLPGGDLDDLYQWGLLGLYKAVLCYDEDGPYKFDIIANINIKNMMRSAIKMANRKKHWAVNCACPLYQTGNDSMPNSNVKLIERLELENWTCDPQDLFIEKESVEEVCGFINRCLSEKERRIIVLHIRGYKQQNISQKLDFDPKVVDNAIQRARRKLHSYLCAQ